MSGLNKDTIKSILPFYDELDDNKIQEILNLPYIDIGKSKFYIGQKFNHLICLGRGINYNQDTQVYAICDCVDHNIILTRLTYLKNGHTTSCGCEQYNMRKNFTYNNRYYIDYLNQIIGDYKIIQKSNERIRGEVVWIGQCIHCGKEIKLTNNWIKNPNTHYICSCNKSLGSSYERKIKEILTTNNIKFETEKIFTDFIYNDTKAHPRFDFYLLDYNCLIEVNGRQHYEPSDFFNNHTTKTNFVRDKIKQEYAIKNNINLIIVPYWEINNLDVYDLLPLSSKFIYKGDEYERHI